MITTLTRVDPALRMDRWYTVAVQPSLLDPVAVICAWGSRRSRYQRLWVLPADSLPEAVATADGIIRQKLRRGYRLT